MRQKPGPQKPSAEKVVKDIRRRTRKQHSSDEKSRIALEELRDKLLDKSRFFGLDYARHAVAQSVSD